MAKRTRPLEKAPGINDPATRSISAVEHIGSSLPQYVLRMLPVALICLALCPSALAQTVVTVKVIPSAITLKCKEEEHILSVLLATTPALSTTKTTTSATAFGIALVPTTKGEVKIFARYWFLLGRAGTVGDQLLLKRDDDTGKLGQKLWAFDEPSFAASGAEFLQACEPDEVSAAVVQALAQAKPPSSVEEVINSFGATGLELKADAAKSDQQNIDKPLTLSEADQVSFAQVMHTLVLTQLGKDPRVTDAGAFSAGGPASNADDRSKVFAELEATRKSLEETGKRVASLSTVIRVISGILLTALVLAVVIALLYFNPKLQRKVFFRADDAVEVRRQALDELYRGFQKIGKPGEAQEKLGEILSSYGSRFNEAKGNLTKVELVYQDLDKELKRFSLSLTIDKAYGDGNNQVDIVAVRQFISDNFGITFVDMGLMQGLKEISDAFNKNLLPLAANDSRFHKRILPQLEETRRHVEAMWSQYSNDACPDGALATLKQEWEALHDTLQPLKRIAPTNALSFAQESVALFEYLHEKFLHQSQRAGDLKTKVERFFNDFDGIQITNQPADAQSKYGPENILISVNEELLTNRKHLAQFTDLSRNIRSLQGELRSSNCASTEIITQATAMARDHWAVLDLLRDYRPANDPGDVLNTVRSLQDKINSATSAVLTVLPKISGTIDVMVTGLIEEFNSNLEMAAKAKEFNERVKLLQAELTTVQAHAADSTQLASALSQYVHLSAEEIIDPHQVQSLLRRFRAGESMHRLLRLRLSAALPTLDQAIEDVRRAGRDDALDALRISDFKEQLYGLLTNMENFPGNVLWKECLSSGFSEQWLHSLLRAELLALTYFAGEQDFAMLVESLIEAGEALQSTMRHLNVRVPFIRLLTKPPDGARVDYGVDPRLSKLPEVKRKVQARLRAPSDFEGGFSFVVDVGLFPFQSENSEDFGGRVILASPAEWA